MACDCEVGSLGPSVTEACPGSSFLIFMTIVNSLIRSSEKISGSCERLVPVEYTDEEYDFVVIGGGAAGSAVAGRLSEISEWKVLLIEAGLDEPAGSEVPGYASSFLGTGITWDYKTTNESHACLATNGSCAWPSGKNLGGNTAHNGMLYLRGNPTDYNNWFEMGNEGWDWETVERFFLMSEDNREIDRVGSKHHSTGGLLPVKRFPYQPPITDFILEAAKEAGFGVNDDFNGDKKCGFSIAQAMNDNGVRRSSSRVFLWPAKNRENFHVSLNSQATRLIIENGRAVGVEYVKDGELRRVSVTKEVVVSGGAVQSPHLFLLSGIGPKDHLESVGVEVIHDLPGVGENLHDHPCTMLEYTIDEPDVYLNNWDITAEYITSQSGPLSAIGSIQSPGFLTTSATTCDFPDIEMYVIADLGACAPGDVGALQSTGRQTVQLSPTFLHPKSRGRITLASKDPLELPQIWANYYGEPEDLDRMIEGMRMAQVLVNTEAFRHYNFTLKLTEACLDHEFDSDEYWGCVAKQENYAIYHQGGSCKMGPSSDPMAVVDHRLRVHGIEGLRVADNSIMPQVTSSSTTAPAIMIGERCAHFIKEDWSVFNTLPLVD